MRTPPGFSRWYFNFKLQSRFVFVMPGLNEDEDCEVLALKLKYHRLKSVVSGLRVTFVCSCEVEVPPAEAGGVESNGDRGPHVGATYRRPW